MAKVSFSLFPEAAVLTAVLSAAQQIFSLLTSPVLFYLPGYQWEDGHRAYRLGPAPFPNCCEAGCLDFRLHYGGK